MELPGEGGGSIPIGGCQAKSERKQSKSKAQSSKDPQWCCSTRTGWDNQQTEGLKSLAIVLA